MGKLVGVTKAGEDYALFHVYCNLLVLLRKRNYIVPETPNFEEFLNQYQVMHHVARSNLSMVVGHVSGNAALNMAVIFMENNDKKAVSVASIRDIHQHLIDSALKQGILIHHYPLSSQAKKEMILDGRRLESVPERSLLFNPTNHFQVPKIHVLKNDEKEFVLKRFNASSVASLPRIDGNDAVCRYYGIRRGDVIGIERICETSGPYMSYRVCARQD